MSNPKIELVRRSALLVVDVQQGFTELCPNELPVPGGIEIVPKINALMELPWKRIDATQDWHPADHCSFHGQRDGIYPAHCVMGTAGAEFLTGLRTDRFHAIWRKGFRQDVEAYAVTAQHPGIISLYRAEAIELVAIVGIATNICCFFAAKDFCHAGFRVCLIEDASAGIDVPEAGLLQAAAKAEGKQLGIEYVASSRFLPTEDSVTVH